MSALDKLFLFCAITDVSIEEDNIVCQEIATINNIFVSKIPLTISDIKELEGLNCILNLENTRTTRNLKERLKKIILII